MPRRSFVVHGLPWLLLCCVIGAMAVVAVTAPAVPPPGAAIDERAAILRGEAALLRQLVVPTGIPYLAALSAAHLLRAAPRATAATVATLPAGTVVQVHSGSGPWVSVTTANGRPGYLLRTQIESLATRTPLTALALLRRALGQDNRYPRLANYNGLFYPWQAPFMATADLIVARRGAPLRALEAVAPHALSLLYERAAQVSLCCSAVLYGLQPEDIPAGWWLTMAGSRLRSALDAHQEWLAVESGRPFARCQDILVDGESMHIWSVRGHWLHVLRGYHSRATRHRAGARIAPHYSYRTDLSNCRIAGPGTSARPWGFNMSSACPRWHGLTWIDVLAHRTAALVRRGGWWGVFYDNLSDLPPSPLVDVTGDGRADGGVVDGVNTWRLGQQRLLAETRRLLPGVPLLVNGDLVLNGQADGREMEGFPLIPGLALSAAIDSYLFDTASGAPLTIVNADTTARSRPDPQAAQSTLGAALLGDGYAAYDFGWLYHGYPWWFDAYDAGTGSALTRAVDSHTTTLSVEHPTRFRAEQIVYLDEEAMRIVHIERQGLVVRRAQQGTLPERHLLGAAVTTPQQRRRTQGYLGIARGAAQLIATPGTGNTLLLRRIPTTIGKASLPESLARPLAPGLTLSVTSTGHYAPNAVRVVLLAPSTTKRTPRTLRFWAKGPAGQSLWLTAGRQTVALVLRATWHRYLLPVGSDHRLVLGFGRIRGTVTVRQLRLTTGQFFVWQRDFSGGRVIVNPTDAPQLIVLPHAYRRLGGDQAPWVDNGQITCAFTLARYRTMILLALPRRQWRCPSAAQRPIHAPHRQGRTRASHGRGRLPTPRRAESPRPAIRPPGARGLTGRTAPPLTPARSRVALPRKSAAARRARGQRADRPSGATFAATATPALHARLIEAMAPPRRGQRAGSLSPTISPPRKTHL